MIMDEILRKFDRGRMLVIAYHDDEVVLILGMCLQDLKGACGSLHIDLA